MVVVAVVHVIFTLVFCCNEVIESDIRMWGVYIHKRERGRIVVLEKKSGLLPSNIRMVCIDTSRYMFSSPLG